jgi:hypothetical protein
MQLGSVGRSLGSGTLGQEGTRRHEVHRPRQQQTTVGCEAGRPWAQQVFVGCEGCRFRVGQTALGWAHEGAKATISGAHRRGGGRRCRPRHGHLRG